MTTRPDDDELVSAVLDGEATPEEVARVEGDPRLRDRLAVLRATAEAVAAPVAQPDELSAARLRSEALATLDTTSTPAAGRVVPKPGSRGPGGVAPWLAVAAAILVVVGIVGALGGGLLDGGSDDQTAGSEADTSSDDEVDEVEGMSGAEGARNEAVDDEVEDATPEIQEPSAGVASTVSTTLPDPIAGTEPATVALIDPPDLLDEAGFAVWVDGEAATMRRAPALEIAYGAENDRVAVGDLTCARGPGRPIATATTTFGDRTVELSIWVERDPSGIRVAHATASDIATCEVLAQAELTRR